MAALAPHMRWVQGVSQRTLSAAKRATAIADLSREVENLANAIPGPPHRQQQLTPPVNFPGWQPVGFFSDAYPAALRFHGQWSRQNQNPGWFCPTTCLNNLVGKLRFRNLEGTQQGSEIDLPVSSPEIEIRVPKNSFVDFQVFDEDPPRGYSDNEWVPEGGLYSNELIGDDNLIDSALRRAALIIRPGFAVQIHTRGIRKQ